VQVEIPLILELLYGPTETSLIKTDTSGPQKSWRVLQTGLAKVITAIHCGKGQIAARTTGRSDGDNGLKAGRTEEG
jgi:hypothetical protein